MKDKPSLYIEVRGPAGAGKTRLSKAIAVHLRRLGFVVTAASVELDERMVGELPSQPRGEGQRVTIGEVVTKRPPLKRKRATP